ncbi:MAG: hypothetical protein V7638_3867 [Acidobacteriota bacterium]|jgi:putative nucleotidyltransferase with HDIG domain
MDAFIFPGLALDVAFFWRIFITILIGYLLLRMHRWVPSVVRTMSSQMQRRTIEALATAINAKDRLTFDHVRRVQIYAMGLGRLAGCSELEIRALEEGALLHDVGKIGVPDNILGKAGKLTADEFDRMKLHPIVGAQILEHIDFEFPIVSCVRHHHERWDGAGYPDGLSGAAIPLTARVLSIVDCFDAVREDRPYRKGMTRQAAIDLVLDGSGSHYDPFLVGLFIKNLPCFEAQIRAERVYSAKDFGVDPPGSIDGAGRKAQPAAGLAS